MKFASEDPFLNHGGEFTPDQLRQAMSLATPARARGVRKKVDALEQAQGRLAAVLAAEALPPRGGHRTTRLKPNAQKKRAARKAATASRRRNR